MRFHLSLAMAIALAVTSASSTVHAARAQVDPQVKALATKLRKGGGRHVYAVDVARDHGVSLDVARAAVARAKQVRTLRTRVITAGVSTVAAVALGAGLTQMSWSARGQGSATVGGRPGVVRLDESRSYLNLARDDSWRLTVARPDGTTETIELFGNRAMSDSNITIAGVTFSNDGNTLHYLRAESGKPTRLITMQRDPATGKWQGNLDLGPVQVKGAVPAVVGNGDLGGYLRQ